MEVVYKKTILQQIRDAKEKANELGKQIDHILLTSSEWKELSSDIYLIYPGPLGALTVYGIEVKLG